MVQKKKVVSKKAAVQKPAGQVPDAALEMSEKAPAAAKTPVSPLERWKMVAEAAYYRALGRGFIGGNPIEDWREAEQEIDAKYVLDYSKVMTSLNPIEMMDQFHRALGAVLRQPGLDLSGVLESQRKNIETLTNANKLVFQNARDMMTRQTEMFRSAMEEATAMMREAKDIRDPKSAATQQTKLIQLGIEKSIASMRDIAESMSESSGKALEVANQQMTENMIEIRALARKIESKS